MEARKLTTENVLEIVANVKRQLCDSLEQDLLAFLKHYLEDIFERALKDQIGADKYQRSHMRQGYRNGYYFRSLTTKFGHLQSLKVPRLRQGSLLQDALDRYQRIHDDVERTIGQLFLAGVSTRRLRALSQELFGQEISPQSVSQATQSLQAELDRYRHAPLDDDYEFLFLDAIFDRVREIGVERKVVLCALGIRLDGTKKILAFRLLDAEDEAGWSAFLAELKARGLIGDHLKMITSDGHKGLLKALKRHYTFVPQQRCRANYWEPMC